MIPSCAFTFTSRIVFAIDPLIDPLIAISFVPLRSQREDGSDYDTDSPQPEMADEETKAMSKSSIESELAAKEKEVISDRIRNHCAQS